MRTAIGGGSFCGALCMSCVSWLATTVGAHGAKPDDAKAACVPFAVRLDHPDAGDQDDLCFWRDADEPSRSLVITSDKKAALIAVYDLQGKLLQLERVPKPGNVDIRQNVELGGSLRDVIVVNQRTDGWKLALFEVDRAARRIRRLDEGQLTTGPNYGVCLYHSRVNGSLYAVITSEAGTLAQYEVLLGADAKPSLRKVRSWKGGKCEGAVADDEFGKLYIAEEEKGVWELGAEPDQPSPGKLVIRLGENGLKPDLEGVTLAMRPGGAGYLIVSSQGADLFFVYERTGGHQFVGSFAIQGAEETDGIDVFEGPAGDQFPQGVFGCHTGATKRCSILLTPWNAIVKELGK